MNTGYRKRQCAGYWGVLRSFDGDFSRKWLQECDWTGVGTSVGNGAPPSIHWCFLILHLNIRYRSVTVRRNIMICIRACVLWSSMRWRSGFASPHWRKKTMLMWSVHMLIRKFNTFKLLPVHWNCWSIEWSPRSYPVTSWCTSATCLKTSSSTNLQLFIDIGGNRECPDVCRLIQRVKRDLSPRLVVVKSERLHDLALSHVKETNTEEDGPADSSRRAVTNTPNKRPVRGTALMQHPSVWWAAVDGLAAEYVERIDDAQKKVLHPLKYSAREDSQGVMICRYYNYRDCYQGDRCPYNHQLCHQCGEEGHKALTCGRFTGTSPFNWEV